MLFSTYNMISLFICKVPFAPHLNKVEIGSAMYLNNTCHAHIRHHVATGSV